MRRDALILFLIEWRHKTLILMVKPRSNVDMFCMGGEKMRRDALVIFRIEWRHKTFILRGRTYKYRRHLFGDKSKRDAPRCTDRFSPSRCLFWGVNYRSTEAESRIMKQQIFINSRPQHCLLPWDGHINWPKHCLLQRDWHFHRPTHCLSLRDWHRFIDQNMTYCGSERPNVHFWR